MSPIISTEGSNQPSPWEKLRNQIYLGSDQFIEVAQRHLEPNRKLTETPRPQRLKPIKPLSHYQETYKNRNQAMARAWLDGHYSLSKIGEHFGCGRSTVNRAVKAFRGKWETCPLWFALISLPLISLISHLVELCVPPIITGSFHSLLAFSWQE